MQAVGQLGPCKALVGSRAHPAPAWPLAHAGSLDSMAAATLQHVRLAINSKRWSSGGMLVLCGITPHSWSHMHSTECCLLVCKLNSQVGWSAETTLYVHLYRCPT